MVIDRYYVILRSSKNIYIFNDLIFFKLMHTVKNAFDN